MLHWTALKFLQTGHSGSIYDQLYYPQKVTYITPEFKEDLTPEISSGRKQHQFLTSENVNGVNKSTARTS